MQAYSMCLVIPPTEEMFTFLFSLLLVVLFNWIFGQGAKVHTAEEKVGSLSDVGVLFYHSLYLCFLHSIS